MTKYLLFSLALFVTACAPSQPTPTHTAIPPTLTSMPPTYTSIPPTQLPPSIEVTFDGNECTVSGPAELPTGKHIFVYKNMSEKKADLWVSLILDGKTYQDLLDLQSEPGEYFPQPSWTVHAIKFRQVWDDSIGGEVYTFYLDKEGEYAMAVGKDPPQGSLWSCGPIWVKEASSE